MRNVTWKSVESSVGRSVNPGPGIIRDVVLPAPPEGWGSWVPSSFSGEEERCWAFYSLHEPQD